MSMNPSFFSSPRFIFLIALLLVAVAVVSLRGRSAPKSSSSNSSAAVESSSSVPTVTSTNVSKVTLASDDDPLSSLGQQWTFLRQTSLTAQAKVLSLSDGIRPVRESVVKLIGKDVSLVLDEFKLIDRAQLLSTLQADGATKITVAGRSGYLVATADISGGTGLLLVGDKTALLLQVSGSVFWPKTPAPEVLSYITIVRVP